MVPGKGEPPCVVEGQPCPDVVPGGPCPIHEFLFRPEELDRASGVPDVVVPGAERPEEMHDARAPFDPAIGDPQLGRELSEAWVAWMTASAPSAAGIPSMSQAQFAHMSTPLAITRNGVGTAENGFAISTLPPSSASRTLCRRSSSTRQARAVSCERSSSAESAASDGGDPWCANP